MESDKRYYEVSPVILDLEGVLRRTREKTIYHETTGDCVESTKSPDLTDRPD